MLETIAEIVNYTKQIIYIGLIVSYKTGGFLISGISGLLYFITNAYNCTKIVSSILLEDFIIFMCDVKQRLFFIGEILATLGSWIISVIETVRFVIVTITHYIFFLFTTAFNIIAKVVEGLIHLVISLKYVILLLGSSIWFLVTAFPLLIVYSFTMITYSIGCLLEELLNIIHTAITQCISVIIETYVFVTDVPFEAMAGLIAGFSIIYILIKFQMLLYNMLKLAYSLVKQIFQLLGIRFLRRQKPVTTRRRRQEQTEAPDSKRDYNILAAERTCIICEERKKCILMLPCRHICFCDVCNVRLRNRACPLCRADIDRTMKVFV